MLSPGSDGSLRDCCPAHYDAVTGLIRPNAHSHMLLSSGHTMAVPPNFFLHPQTGHVLPIAGNVAYDPESSTLVITTDLCAGIYHIGCKTEEPKSIMISGSTEYKGIFNWFDLTFAM